MNEEKPTPALSDDVARQLVKQLKRLNRWVTFFGITFLLIFGIVIFLLVQVFLFVKATGDTFQNFQQSTTQKLDVKSQVCSGTDAFSSWLKNNTTACQ
jgi:cytoskeletal protein RodZ